MTWPPETESSRTHFEVLGLEASSPRKLPCPRLEESTIFELLKFRWKTPENLQKPFFGFFKSRSPEKTFLKTFFFWDRLKKIFRTFFLENTCVCVLGPWPREGLSLALKFFVFLALASSLVSSTPPLHLFLFPMPILAIFNTISFSRFALISKMHLHLQNKPFL